MKIRPLSAEEENQLDTAISELTSLAKSRDPKIKHRDEVSKHADEALRTLLLCRKKLKK